MSNGAGGVRTRLGQFTAGIERNGLHSGAMRFFREDAGGRFRNSRLQGDSFSWR
jgi:hypothetical protein